MATILVVDDRPLNRDFLNTLLGYHQHRVIEAADGVEALAAARRERPDLVLSDILMPRMDGYELVRKMREDAGLAGVPIVFCTAHYLEREARALASESGVAYVLVKPCEPEEVLRTVKLALDEATTPAAPPPEEFDREHLRLLTNKVAKKTDEVHWANLRLRALIEAGQELALERDPVRLVELCCREAREMMGAGSAIVGIEEGGGPDLRQLCIHGAEDRVDCDIVASLQHSGLLDEIVGHREPRRLRSPPSEPAGLGFSPRHWPVRSFLGVPIFSPTRVHGWLCLCNKIGAEEFSEEDEALAGMFAAQLALAYENARLYEEVKRHNEELENRVRDRTAALEASNRDLESFTYSVSHDLRAPLRALEGFATLLGEQPETGAEPESQRYALRIQEQAHVMNQMVADLLALARVGQQELRSRPTALGSVVQEVVSELKTQTEGREIEWRLGGLPACDCAPGLIRQVFYNLLSNAVKFTAKQERATIEVDQMMVEGEPVFFVRDNGAGFDMEYAANLFGVFQRFHPASEFPGTGAGLALVKRIVQRHGGRIWAKSAPGAGATFFFTLGESLPELAVSGPKTPTDYSDRN
jgi:signal transduction histidine kinase/CheY-like chemotaxis protein